MQSLKIRCAENAIKHEFKSKRRFLTKSTSLKKLCKTINIEVKPKSSKSNLPDFSKPYITSRKGFPVFLSTYCSYL